MLANVPWIWIKRAFQKSVLVHNALCAYPKTNMKYEYDQICMVTLEVHAKVITAIKLEKVYRCYPEMDFVGKRSGASYGVVYF